MPTLADIQTGIRNEDILCSLNNAGKFMFATTQHPTDSKFITFSNVCHHFSACWLSYLHLWLHYTSHRLQSHCVCLGPFLVMPFCGVHHQPRLGLISQTAVQLYNIQSQPYVPETHKQTSDWIVLIPWIGLLTQMLQRVQLILVTQSLYHVT